MSVWWWVLVWVLLVLCSLAYLAWRLWGLWRRAKALGREIATAQERLDRVEGELEQLGEQATRLEDLAVLSNPIQVAMETSRVRQHGRAERQRRRAASAPAWAKHVD